MQITLTPEQQAAFCRGESITIVPPPKAKWPFKAPRNSDYHFLKVGAITTYDEDHALNNVFTSKSTVNEVYNKLRFLSMCARFREYFEPDWEEVWDGNLPVYSVVFSKSKNEYVRDWVTNDDRIGTIHMSRACATALVDLLNRNQVPGFKLPRKPS